MSYDGLLIDKLKVVTRTRGDYGSYSESVGDSQPCRIMFQNAMVTDYKGIEVMSRAKIFCQKSLSVSHEDKLQLGPEDYKIKHAIALINKPRNSAGHHHTEIIVT